MAQRRGGRMWGSMWLGMTQRSERVYICRGALSFTQVFVHDWAGNESGNRINDRQDPANHRLLLGDSFLPLVFPSILSGLDSGTP